MEVLKTQVDLETWSVAHECPTCKSTLSVNAGDIRYHWNLKKDETYYVTCMVCDNRCYLPVKILPEVVQAVVRKDRSDPPTYVDD